MNKFVLVAAITLLLSVGLTASGETIAVTLDNQATPSFAAYDFSLGYTFTVDEPLVVSHLGRFDVDDDDTIADSITRLWEFADWFGAGTSTILASATVSSAASVEVETGLYDTYFTALSKADQVTLSPNKYYCLATEVLANDFCYGGLGVLADWASEVNWIAGIATTVGSPAMPTNANSTTFTILNQGVDCYFGPNMQLVPEPSTVILLVMGLVALAIRRKR